MSKHQIFENIRVEKLIFGGKGLAIAPDGKKIIITGGCIPGSIVHLRILKNKSSHYEAQEVEVVQKSSLEVPLELGHQLYGGAKWLPIRYTDQLSIKEEQVRESLDPVLAYQNTQVSSIPTWHRIIASPQIYGYRNKVEFSFGKYISEREGVHDEFRFGFHAQGQFDRIVDCSYCALADQLTNDIFHEVDQLTRASVYPTYDPKRAEGFWRHFVVRRSEKFGTYMLIFSVNSLYSQPVEDFFTDMVGKLTKKFPQIVSIYFLENTGRADIVTGNPICIFGSPTIEEKLFDLVFEIQPKSFFQVNTLGAEKLYQEVIDRILYKGGVLLDLYAGTGTIGSLLSAHFDRVYSVELLASASEDGKRNAMKNGISNMSFVCERVEVFAQDFLQSGGVADTIVIDPPRDGMHPSTLPSLLAFGVREMIYVSCNPSTLARDLAVLTGKVRETQTEALPKYRVTDITPVDMFPHTHHIETVVRLEKY